VTGATGYIGEAVAVALRRNGHEVYGLARNAEKAKSLILSEVNVVIGDLAKVESWKEVASKCSVLIHAAADYGAFEAVDNLTMDTFLELGKAEPKSKLVIYTSGILVYPDSNTKVRGEDDPVDPNPFPMLKNRAAREQQTISNKDVHGVVIRPAFVFGKNMTHHTSTFKQALEGKVTLAGRADIVYSHIHIDDLAESYVRVVEASPAVVGGQIFNIGDNSRATNLEIATAFARVAGYKGEVTVDVKSGMPFLDKSVIVSFSKATRILGWTPKHGLILDEVETLFATWKARNNIH